MPIGVIILAPFAEFGFSPCVINMVPFCFQSPEYTALVNKFNRFFSDVHRIELLEESLNMQVDWIDECIARLFIHSRIFQCSKFYGPVMSREECPGGCGLRKHLMKTKLSRARGWFPPFKAIWKGY